MKRIVQVAMVALACSAGAAWAEQSQEQKPQAQEEQVAQVSTGSERIGAPRQEAQPRKASFHEMSGLAGDGYSPSRGGPLDD
ncbi:MAG TPA: hypothetical protein VHP37_27995 [Burkholderiales bacterium]|nr:hypothetical protein [Burkholderiales bacterium]